MYRKFLAGAAVVVAVALPLTQANAAPRTTASDSCRTGDAPLPDGASISKTSRAGLAARGWDSWSPAGSRGCFQAGIAAARSAPKQQRIAIVLNDKTSTFTLTPLTSGPIKQDSGGFTACCWTNRDVIRDGQSASLGNPKLTFDGTHGTFTWRGHLRFVDLDNDYTVVTARWKILRGTGAYAHLEGHGRQAFVQMTTEGTTLADKAEGLVDLGGS
jgi:hypothetical protein